MMLQSYTWQSASVLAQTRMHGCLVGRDAIVAKPFGNDEPKT